MSVRDMAKKLEQTVPAETDEDSGTDAAFEDAPDTKSVRSLTRKTSSAHTRKVSSPVPVAPLPVAEGDGGFDFGLDKSAVQEQQELKQQQQQDQQDEHETEIEHDHVAGEDGIDTEETSSGTTDSATTTQQRVSVASGGELEPVDLDDDGSATKVKPTLRPNGADHGKKPSFSNIANMMPSMPWTATNSTGQDSPVKSSASTIVPTPASPASVKDTTASATTGANGPQRKLTGAFSWLSRSASRESGSSPPAPSPRRNTASSIATLSSNPEMMLGRLEEEGSPTAVNGGSRTSLKDRFKAMRMREEAGITNLPEEGDKESRDFANIVNKGPGGLSVMTPSYDGADGNGLALTPRSPIPPSPAPNLAPGTASGAGAGPSSFAGAPVDWDLWQAVVNEGPAAVAKTSPEELSRAIGTGIPNAIRGVIWQVLAQSKNEALEEVYAELVARGTDKDKDRQSNSSIGGGSNGISGGIGGGGGAQHDVASSASSIRSEQSGANGSSDRGSETAAATATTIVSSRTPDLERIRAAKEDAAKLQKLERVIRRDLGARTSYSKFATSQGLQEPLFGVCKAYALYDEGVGYAQGMNFLIMPLLFNMPEEEAFCLLVKLMSQYQLRELFTQDMPGLHLHLYQFERLLEDIEPALYCHLKRRGITSHLYATQWFLTLFAYRFPLQLVLRIYDIIFSEGLSAIIKFGIVLMQKNASTLLGMNDMSQLTTYLKDRLFDVYIDANPSTGSLLENGFFGSSSAALDKEVYHADQLVHDACEVKMTPQLLDSYRKEWEESTKATKDRELELEMLRSQNSSFGNTVRKLEERLEAVDREQTDLANELVRTKVQNEEVKDENESLKGQVKELKVVIESQPAEIEEKWQAERDALVASNARVHEENQKVEKEMGELEEQLVRTKMQYAEVNAQHETLSRRWTDLKKHIAD